jgi:archaemetzincin
VTPFEPRIRSIRVQPVGDAVALEVLDNLAADLALVFRTSVHVETVPLDTGFALDAERLQFHSTAILTRLSEAAPLAPGSRILGVTERDLYVPVLTFVFGEAQLGGQAALISLCRLREAFYGLPPDDALLRDRAAKEAVHELGHTLGLRHCPNWWCVMASAHAVEKLDLKSREFCAACERVATAAPQAARAL